MAFKIEKNIPLKRAAKYPFDEMEVGDSFAVSAENYNAAKVAAWAFGKNHNKKFSVRKDDGAYRVWRVK